MKVVYSDNAGGNPLAGLVKASDGNFYGTASKGGASGYGTVFRMSPAGELTTLCSFNGANGNTPQAGLALGADGNLYGTTVAGGANDSGTVYCLTLAGTLKTLFSFNNANGRKPQSKLLLANDGNLYGSTSGDSVPKVAPTIFKITHAGALSTVATLPQDSSVPVELVQGNDGNFYGTTAGGGGVLNYGTIMKITPTGVVSTLALFNGSNGQNPGPALVKLFDGSLYGTAARGGIYGHGTAFKVTMSGTLSAIYHFQEFYGDPQGGLSKGNDINFYGTGYVSGDQNSAGTLFKLTPDGILTTLYRFDGIKGGHPQATLALGNDGNFYGVTNLGGAIGQGASFRVTPTGDLAFLGSLGGAQGRNPFEGVIEASDGSFYGTTAYGGAASNNVYDYGTVFKVSPQGSFVSLHSFGSSDGGHPLASLTQGGDGLFYGVTYDAGPGGYGTAFKMRTSGVVTTINGFTNANNDGASPITGMVQGSDGNFYGTTFEGGDNLYGSIFKVSAAGTLNKLASLTYNSGRYPYGLLVQDSTGAFYGTASTGGAGDYGAIFKVTSSGALTTVASFDSTHGRYPRAGLTMGRDGNFFGTTYYGGVSATGTSLDRGTVFRMTPDGTLAPLAVFTGTNGSHPWGALVEGSDGAFYGTTYDGGLYNFGTIFRVSRSGVLTTLCNFDGISAAHPKGRPTFSVDGSLYGTADQLVIWKLSVKTPEATLSAPSTPATTSITLNGTLNPNGTALSVSFDYGTSSQFGLSIPATPAPSDGETTQPVSAALTGLAPHTTYYYRLAASNALGVSYSPSATLVTANTAPAAPAGAVVATTGDQKQIALPFSATDDDGDTLVVTAVTPSSGLTVDAVSGGNVTFTPAVDYVGDSTLSYTVSDGFGGTATGLVVVTVADNDPPSIQAPASGFFPRSVREDVPLPDYRAEAVQNDNIGISDVMQNPAPGSLHGVGDLEVTLTASDAAGNRGQTKFTVTITSTRPSARVLAQKGSVIPGAGEPGSGIAAGATWATFGTPCALETGDVVYKAGVLDADGSLHDGIFLQSGANGSVRPVVRTGDFLPQAADAGVKFSSFSDPVAVESSAGNVTVVFSSRVSGQGTTPGNRDVLCRWVSRPGETAVIEVLGRCGRAANGKDAEGGDVKGFKIAAFKSFGIGAEGSLWALAGVSGANPSSRGRSVPTLLNWSGSESEPRIVLSTGDRLALGDGKSHPLTAISTLAPAGGSPGDGRWIKGGALVMRLSFADRMSGIFLASDVPSAGGLVELARKEGGVKLEDREGNELSPNAAPASFRLPCLDMGGAVSLCAELTPLPGVIKPANARGVFRLELILGPGLQPNAGEQGWTRIAFEGEEGGADGAAFLGFKDPVSNSSGQVAFLTTERRRSRGKQILVPALWSSSPVENGEAGSAIRNLVRVAAAGEEAPEVGGARFASFSSVALPEWDHAGVLFTARLRRGQSQPLTALDDMGLWAVDSQGALRLLLRKGYNLPGADSWNPRVKSFQVLSTVRMSAGQGRATDHLGEVFCVVQFGDKSTAIVKLQVP